MVQGHSVSPEIGVLSSSSVSVSSQPREVTRRGLGAALIPLECHKLDWPHPVPSGAQALAGHGQGMARVPGVCGGTRGSEDKTRLSW